MRSVVTADGRPDAGGLVMNTEFLRFAEHWGFRARACRPYRAQTKGKVERPIRYCRQSFFYGRTFVGDDDPQCPGGALVRDGRQRPAASDDGRAAPATLRARRARAARAVGEAAVSPPRRADGHAPPTRAGPAGCDGRTPRIACVWRGRAMTGAPGHRDRIRAMLADLKLPGALEAVDTILAEVDRGGVTVTEAIARLLDAQISLRNNRRLQTAMRSSRLPAIKTLAQFDFAFQPSIRREQIESLHELGFVRRKENVIFLGPPGVGKTHLAISLAIAAAEHGRRVYYGTLVALIESLEQAKAAGQLARRLRVLSHPALLIVDEIGYLPVSRDGAVLFFQLINTRYERAATVLTSNKGFEDWGTILGDEVMAAALIDRLMHHCHVVNIRGNSYRMREHTDLLRAISPQRTNAPTTSKRRARKEDTTV